jgi:hypothetical protein
MGGTVARIEEMRNVYKILVGNFTGRDNSKDLGVEGNIISKWVLRKHGGKVWTGSIWLRRETSGGPL